MEVKVTQFQLPAISRERIEGVLKDNGWRYHIDSDGDVGGVWDDNIFYFMLKGEEQEILWIQGRWHIALTVAQQGDAREVLDDWHRDRFWPKGYTRVDDDGELRIFAEHIVDFEHGVTDEQLALTIQEGISSGLQLFAKMAEAFAKG
jgi:hypothetical protein